MNTEYPQHTTIQSVKTLKQRIMRRIYFLYMVRNLVPLAFDCVAIVIAAFIVTLFVSVKDVLANLGAASAGSSISRFSVAAFSDTELETKFLLLILGVVGFLAVRDLKRAWSAVQVIREKKESKNP